MGPVARTDHAMAYDEARERIVLFSGLAGNAGSYLQDTWEWDGSEWTQVADMGPSARYGFAMAYDVRRGRVMVFGGNPGPLADTWEWSGTEWLQIADTGPESTLVGMAYDNLRDRMVLLAASPGLPHTWEFANATWTRVQNIGPSLGLVSGLPEGPPKMAYAKNRTVLFAVSGPTRPGETWDWDGHVWRRRQNMGPLSRVGHELAYDSDRDRVVLFGGFMQPLMGQPVTFGDTWELTIEESQ
jgi:hypothetical protein